MSARDQDYTGTAVDVGLRRSRPALLGLAALTAVVSATGRHTLRRDVSGMVAPLLPDLTALAALALCVVDGAGRLGRVAARRAPSWP